MKLVVIRKAKSTLAEHSESVLTDNVNVIGGDLAVSENTPNILSYEYKRYDE